METIEKKYDSPMSVILGVDGEKIRPNSNSLKELSMSEILKLAEDRAKLEGINRRSTDNPWHKRMAVSDNITRYQTRRNSLTSHRQTGSIAAKDQLDNNEEFFDNLMKKMTEEQFIPCGTSNKKRTCLWNKENSSDRIKRQKENRMNKKLISPRMEMFGKRLLPLQGNNAPARVKIQSQPVAIETRDQDRDVPPYKSSLDVIQEDINIKEVNLRLKHSNSSTATTITVSNSSYLDEAADVGVSYCSQETLKLDRNHSVKKIELDLIHEASPLRYDVERYSENVFDSPRLSTIDDRSQFSMVVESPVLHAIETEFNTSIHLTPPGNCKACNIDEKEYDDNANKNSGQLLSPMISRPSDYDVVEITDQSLFT